MNYIFIIFLGVLLILGLASTRVVKIVKLPNVTGYLVVGLLAALFCLIIDKKSNIGLISDLTFLNDFISSIALGFIALSIGQEFKLSKIKEYGKNIISITFWQALLAAFLVDIVLIVICLLLKIDLSIAICLGAIATATAPAATLMVIHQYNAKGPLVDRLLPVVAFDDAIGLVVFAISMAISKVIATGSKITLFSIGILPLLEILGSIILGLTLGVIMHFVINYFKSRNNHAITIIAFTLLGVGLCELINTIKTSEGTLEFSNLLCCMMIGAMYVNLAKKDTDIQIVNRDIDVIDHWTPFLFMLFFVLSGAHLVISASNILNTMDNSILYKIIIIYVSYMITRSAGKYFGARIGCKLNNQSEEITKYLGITLLPQAGVAIGMANQISRCEAFKSTSNLGNIIVTVVLCATLVYELVGPLLTKWALKQAHEISE